jgi:hypothetical protein
MAISTIGTVPQWGIASAQTGFVLDTQEEDWTISERYSLSLLGEEQGVVMYNPRCNITITGEEPTANPFAVRLAAAVTLGNGLTNFANGSVAAIGSANIILFGVRRGLAREGFRTFSASVRGHPNFTA